MKKNSRLFLYIILVVSIMVPHADIICAEEDHASIVLPKAPHSIRIMTYNIRRQGKETTIERLWQNRSPLVFSLLHHIQPDIFGLQEPTDQQVTDIRAQLPSYFSSFGKSRGASWWGLVPDEYTPIFYNTNKFTLLEHGTFSINTIDTWFGWMPWHAPQTGWLPRTCTWGKFKENITGNEFYIYNTHLDHMYKKAQLYSAKIIASHITKYAHHAPVILIGDFNTAFESDIKAIFANFQHAQDIAHKHSGPHETFTGWDNTELKWIDHILLTNADNIELLYYDVIESAPGIYPSDHRPVFVDIVFKNK